MRLYYLSGDEKIYNIGGSSDEISHYRSKAKRILPDYPFRYFYHLKPKWYMYYTLSRKTVILKFLKVKLQLTGFDTVVENNTF